jgi:hypothetical protein
MMQIVSIVFILTRIEFRICGGRFEKEFHRKRSASPSWKFADSRVESQIQISFCTF